MCTFLLWSYTYTTSTTARHNNHTKAHHPPEKERKQEKWVIMLMNPCSSKKKEEERKGQKYKWRTSVAVYTCTWSKYLNCMATWRHIVWTCKINGKDEHIPMLPYTQERGLALRESYTMSTRVNWAFKSLPLFLKSENPPRRKTCIDSWWQVLKINRWERRC